MNKSKNKGTSLESKVVKMLEKRGFKARRLALNGPCDVGDIEAKKGDLFAWVIECKNYKQFNQAKLEEWLEQTRIETENYKKRFEAGLVIGVLAVKIPSTSLALWISQGKIQIFNLNTGDMLNVSEKINIF